MNQTLWSPPIMNRSAILQVKNLVWSGVKVSNEKNNQVNKDSTHDHGALYKLPVNSYSKLYGTQIFLSRN